jgi:hypothetical protein
MMPVKGLRDGGPPDKEFDMTASTASPQTRPLPARLQRLQQQRRTARSSRLSPWAVALAVLTVSAAGHAANGEAGVAEARLDEPMLVAIQAARDTAAPDVQIVEHHVAPAPAMTPHVPVRPPARNRAPRTRADVRESLQTASHANMLLRNGEMAEPQELLQAREDFIAMQIEQMHQEYLAAVARSQQVALAARQREAGAVARAESDRLWQLVDEATDRIAMRPEEVEVWVEPDTTVEELVGYIEQSAHPDGVTVLLVKDPEQDAD